MARAKEVDRLERMRSQETADAEVEGEEDLRAVFRQIRNIPGSRQIQPRDVEIGSMIYAVKPGDGSAREQAASCQRVLGGLANICKEYATKRYRSNVINWGMLPFQTEEEPEFQVGDYIYVPGIRKALDGDLKGIAAYVIKGGKEALAAKDACVKELRLYMADMTAEEREIVKAGCLINYNRNRQKG